MIKKLIITALLLGSFMLNKSQADIIEIQSILEAKDIFNKANKDSLILFDIDYVLTQPSTSALQMGAINKYKNIWKNLVGNLSPLEQNFLSTLAVTSDKTILVEESMIAQIADLQAREAKVFALTGILTGSAGNIHGIEKWRFETLKSLGIDFSKNSFQIQKLIFSTLPQYNSQFPQLVDGILYSNGDSNKQEKVIIFKELLNLLKIKCNWLPKEIIMIDDREHNLLDVEKLCYEFLDLKFIGLHYKGAKNYPRKMPTEIKFENIWQNLVQTSKKVAQESLASQRKNHLK